MLLFLSKLRLIWIQIWTSCLFNISKWQDYAFLLWEPSNKQDLRKKQMCLLMLHPNFRTELKIREFAYSKRILPNPNFVARFGRIRRFGRLYVKQHSAKRKQLTNSRLSRTNTESRISGICTSLAELKRKWNKEKHACKTRKQITNQESRIIYYHTRYIYIPVCCASSASQPRLTLARDRSCMSLHASYRLSSLPVSPPVRGERERERGRATEHRFPSRSHTAIYICASRERNHSSRCKARKQVGERPLLALSKVANLILFS